VIEVLKRKVVRGSVQFLSPIQSSFYSPALFRINAPNNFSVQGIIGEKAIFILSK
jgi:hypothetical protein